MYQQRYRPGKYTEVYGYRGARGRERGVGAGLRGMPAVGHIDGVIKARDSRPKLSPAPSPFRNGAWANAEAGHQTGPPEWPAPSQGRNFRLLVGSAAAHRPIRSGIGACTQPGTSVTSLGASGAGRGTVGRACSIVSQRGAPAGAWQGKEFYRASRASPRRSEFAREIPSKREHREPKGASCCEAF
jgi:hypothetical protein